MVTATAAAPPPETSPARRALGLTWSCIGLGIHPPCVRDLRIRIWVPPRTRPDLFGKEWLCERHGSGPDRRIRVEPMDPNQGAEWTSPNRGRGRRVTDQEPRQEPNKRSTAKDEQGRDVGVRVGRRGD